MRAFGRVASLRSTDRNVCFTGKPNPGATTLRSLVRSGRRKLETSRNHTSHRDIFVDLFPAQRSTPNLNSDLPEVFIGRIAKAAKACGRKSEDATVVQLDENIASINPTAQGQGFAGELNGYDGTHGRH